MKKQVIIALIAALAVIGVPGFIKYLQISGAMAANAHQGPPPEAVTTTTAANEKWPRELDAVGSVSAYQGTTISAEEPGKVVKIHFESGDQVGEGAPLVDLDTSVEEAQLKGLLASADQARLALKRAEALRSKDANSEAELEKAQAQSRAAHASAESMKATIAKKHITAPFAGTAGIRLVNLGQFVSIGTPIVPLHALDTVYINFSLPQQSLPLLATGQIVKVSVDAYEDQDFEGTLNAVNPEVDPNTRNIALQAVLTNPSRKLRPGMFARVKVVLPESDDLIVIPASSINYAPYGDTVYVIESSKGPAGEIFKVRPEVVKLGKKRGDQVAVLSGLKAGEQIVTSGTFKLRPGAQVIINNKIQPSNDPAPKPADT